LQNKYLCIQTQIQLIFLKNRPWWREFHNEINAHLQKFLPNTHIVAMFDCESFYTNFITRSQFYSGETVKIIKMRRSECHLNCKTLYKKGKVGAVVFGYALSTDGLFRAHSWGIRNDQVIETTEPRLVYFGYKISNN
jgi:hypothetical protein